MFLDSTFSCKQGTFLTRENFLYEKAFKYLSGFFQALLELHVDMAEKVKF